MRQVPYLIIGSGRMAAHMQRYLSLLELPFHSWSRKNNTLDELKQLSTYSERILLLIKDDAIANFVSTYPFIKSRTLIHFSGNQLIKGVWAAHPLMTFISELYDLETYQSVPFVLEESAPEFEKLLPGLSNPHHKIPDAARAYYHAMCVVSANFTVILWDKFLSEIEARFNLPASIAHPYLNQVKHNLVHHREQALTGPLIRGDQKTIQSHLEALADDDFKTIYEAFVKVYEEKRGKSYEYS